MENSIDFGGIKVPYGIVCNLIRSAVEAGYTYGCGYWGYADEDKSVKPKNIDLSVLGEFEKDEKECWYVHWPLFNGGKVVFIEHDDESIKPEPVDYDLDIEKIKLGLSIMANKYPKKFAEVMCEEIDGPLGEEFLQLCLLEDLKYG